ncbi:MAG: leucine-rich repeat protein [Treponema sp.]|nr:leucine-rich repeat protein [Treponema sp.]
MPKCKVCGFRLNDGVTKCPMCGAMAGSTVAGEVSPDLDLPKYTCPACHAQLIGEHRYCTSCGADLKNAAETVQENVTNASSANLSATANVTASGLKETPMEAFKYEVVDGKYILIRLKDTSLTEVVIPDSVTEINSEVFYGTGITSVVIPNSVKKIKVRAFQGCKNLVDVTIPNSVDEIGIGAFHGCENLMNIVLPESIKVIGESAFGNCKSLTDMTIPYSVTKIGVGAFEHCENLQRLTILNPYVIFEDKTVTMEGNQVRSLKGSLGGLVCYCDKLIEVKIGDKSLTPKKLAKEKKQAEKAHERFFKSRSNLLSTLFSIVAAGLWFIGLFHLNYNNFIFAKGAWFDLVADPIELVIAFAPGLLALWGGKDGHSNKIRCRIFGYILSILSIIGSIYIFMYFK